MLQFYFLSIATNLIGGFILASDKIIEKFPNLTAFAELFKKNSSKMMLGIFTIIFGVFKILSVTKGDIIVVGDIIPALSGIIVGSTLAVESYKMRSTVSTPAVERLDNVFVKNKSLIGIAGIIIGLLHFLFPSVLLL